MWVKICGITRCEDAVAAARFGADALGLVFADSPRNVTPDLARKISATVGGRICKVGVFADADIDEIRSLRKHCSLDFVQLHGSEDPDFCARLGRGVIKAFRLGSSERLSAALEYPCDLVLVEIQKSGGISGPLPPIERECLSELARSVQLVIAGGLKPGNVGGVVRAVAPFGVDVSRGVEASPGIKDPVLMYGFIEAAMKAAYDMRFHTV